MTPVLQEYGARFLVAGGNPEVREGDRQIRRVVLLEFDSIDRALGPAGNLAAAGIQPEAANRIWSRFQAAPDRERWSRSWSLYILQRWCESNEVAA